MTTLLTREQMQAMDRIAIEEIGIPSLVLMEVAGRAVAEAAEEVIDELGGGAVLAVSGSGNNGGDAVVAARHLLERGVETTLVVLAERGKTSEDLEAQLAIAERLGIRAEYLPEDQDTSRLVDLAERHDVIIDGIFGTGLARPVTGRLAEVIRVLDDAERTIVAVDVPSGIDADTGQVLGAALRADITVTFQFPKMGHVLFPGRDHAGDLRVVDIGIPPSLLPRVAPAAEIIDDRIIAEALPERAEDTHKGSYGHLLVIAGVPDRPGSALLTGRAALRTGAGLVTVGSDAETIRRLAPALDELMGLVVGDEHLDAGRIRAALEERTALAIGPSLPPTGETRSLLVDILKDARVPAVLDAGALTALGGDVAWLRERPAPTVLTPHPGEMAQLVGLDTRAVQADRVRVARSLAEASGAHVVLKGASTVVAHPDGMVGVVVRGNPGMATGGSGDVLTGVIGALLAQGVPVHLAAAAGAQLHAVAGDDAVERRGTAGLVASDIIEALPNAARVGTEAPLSP